VYTILSNLAVHLDRRIQPRFWSVFFGLLMCREKRRRASAWFRAAGIGTDFQQAYLVIGSVGRRVKSLSSVMLRTIAWSSRFTIAGPVSAFVRMLQPG